MYTLEGQLIFQSFGASGTVTGSKHLVVTPNGNRILLDCGLFQGHNKDKDDLNRHFGFDPQTIDAVVLSHAHIDHSGLLPRLVREGFTGKIFATPATISLCRIMLADSAHIQTDDLKYVNKRRLLRNEEPIEPLYDEADVEACLELFIPLVYNTPFDIADDTVLEYTDAGHLLGSAAAHLSITTPEGVKRITFTGDIGRYKTAILKDPEPFPQCDYLICESTYGNRLHDSLPEAEKHILEIVEKVCIGKKGKLIIPAFSVGRTQTLIYALDKLQKVGALPNIPVYVDSPLSYKATEVMLRHTECYNQDILDYMKKDENPFHFKNLTYITDVEDSKALNKKEEPCIIVSASGMAEAGRVKHHIKNNIEDPNNAIMLIGYCTPDSLGGRLRDGNKEVKIFGEMFEVKARIYNFESYSSHADYEGIFTYLECQDKAKIKELFLVHGEEQTVLSFKEKFMERGFGKVSIPRRKELFVL